MKRRLIPQVIGTKHFEGTIDITDPCYDKDVWCRMNAVVKPGDYECRIWKQNESYKDGKGEIHKWQTVRIIGIYLDGNIPAAGSGETIGSIGVDAGLAGFFMNKPDYNDEQWNDFCESIEKGHAWIKDEGFFSSSGDGDGSYDVVAYKKNEEIVALEILF